MTKATPQELEALAAEILGDAAMTAPSIRETLKPCPFCGSTRLESGGDDKFVGVRCLDCDATGPNHYITGKQWNTRAAILASGLVMAGTSTTDPIVRAAFDALNVAAPAVENLACNQEQCDFDGVMVKVSRQALDEVLTAINEVALVLAKAKLASGFVTAERPNESAIRADERERCARVAERTSLNSYDAGECRADIAAAIRVGGAK